MTMDENGNFGKLVVETTKTTSCYDFGSVENTLVTTNYPAYKEIMSNQSPATKRLWPGKS